MCVGISGESVSAFTAACSPACSPADGVVHDGEEFGFEPAEVAVDVAVEDFTALRDGAVGVVEFAFHASKSSALGQGVCGGGYC